MVAYAIVVPTEVLVFRSLGNAKLVALLIPISPFLSYLPIYTALTMWVFIMLSMLFAEVRSYFSHSRISISHRYTDTFHRS
jgi:hypothetical protein